MTKEVDGIVEKGSSVWGIVVNTAKSYPVLAIAGAVAFAVLVIVAIS